MDNTITAIINLFTKTERRDKNKNQEKQFECVYLRLQCNIYEIENYGISKLELINLYKDIEKKHFELINITTREKFISFLCTIILSFFPFSNFSNLFKLDKCLKIKNFLFSIYRNKY